MQTSFLITARLKSKRLPKKILLKVNHTPLVVHMINRIKYSSKINKIIICTSTNKQDNPLEKIAQQEGIECYRGSENDVLKRLLYAAKKYKLDYFANMTADVPMIDPTIIDDAVKEYNKTNVDLILPENYCFNGCHIIRVSSLEKICKIKKEHNTECWIDFFKTQKNFYIHKLKVKKEKKYRHIKTSLDYPEDYLFIKKIFKNLYNSNKIFTNKDIISLVKKNPELIEINLNKFFLQRWKNHIASLKLNLFNQ